MVTSEGESIASRIPWRLLAVLALIGGGVGGFFIYRSVTGNESSATAEMQTVAVSRQTISSTLFATGTAKAAQDVSLRFLTAGRVAQVNVKIGQQVKAGDVLIKLDTTDVENKVALAEVNLATAQIKAGQAQQPASDSDLAALDQAFITAELAVQKSQNDLTNLTEPPTASSLASAQQGVDAASAAYATAQNNLRKLEEGASDADITALQAAVTSAEVTVQKAENALANAESSVVSAHSVFLAARSAYCALPSASPTPVTIQNPDVCDDDPIEDVSGLMSELSDSHTPALARAAISTPPGSGLIPANNSYKAALNAVENAEDDVEAANAALDSAEAKLAAAQDGAKPEDIEAAKAAVTSANQALQAAILKQQDLAKGADADSIALAQTAVESSQAGVLTASAKREKALAGADPDDIALLDQGVRLAQLQLDAAKKALSDASLVAPFDGTIGDVQVKVGDLVGPSTQLAPVTLLTPNALKVTLSVGETDLPSIKVGMKGQITFSALPGNAYPLTVTGIGLSPQTTNGLTSYSVEADMGAGLSNKKPAPGMTGSGIIITEVKQNALSVPAGAVRRRGSDLTVDVLNEDGTTETRVVTTGAADSQNTEILTGVSEGDKVVMPSTTRSAEKTPTPRS